MVHYEGIWNELELQKKKKIILKQGRVRAHYDTFWNDIWNSYEKK